MRFGVVTDAHLAPAGTPPASWHDAYALEQAPALLHAAVARCVAEEVEAIVLLGDLAHQGDAPSLAAALRIAAGTGIPTWVVSGNHDTEVGTTTLTTAASPFPTITVAPWGTVSIGVGRLIGLDLADARTASIGSIAWDDAPTLLLTHYPVLTLKERLAGAGFLDAGDLANVGDLRAAVEERSGPTIVLHGHQHVRASAVAGPILQLSGAALIEPPHEVAIVDVVGQGASINVVRRCVAVAPSASVRLPVLDPAAGWWIWDTVAPGRRRADSPSVDIANDHSRHGRRASAAGPRGPGVCPRRSRRLLTGLIHAPSM